MSSDKRDNQDLFWSITNQNALVYIGLGTLLVSQAGYADPFYTLLMGVELAGLGVFAVLAAVYKDHIKSEESTNVPA